jgi:carbon monoxide dehydrogenase subunit G
MRVGGTYASAIAPTRLWRALSDPERLGGALPGVADVRRHGADRFSARLRPATNVGVTPLLLEAQIADRVEGERVRIVGDGAAGESRVVFDVALTLVPCADGGASVSWDANVDALGPLASLTQRVLGLLLRDQVTDVLMTAERQAGHAEA